jgi:Domain of unknown function (DUF4129)
VARRSTVMNAPSRPPLLAVLGMLALVFVVWAAAAPRGVPAARWRGGANDATTTSWDSFIFRYGCAWGCLSPGEGSDTATSDAVGAAVGWTFVAVIALGSALVLALLLRARGATDPVDARTTGSAVPPALDPDLVATAVTGDTAGRLDTLLAGTPAQGIIAAWVRLEATLSDTGVPLSPSRTSSEVCGELVRQVAVDRGTLGDLAALYREARWSHHALTEAHRSRAATSYRALDADLREAARHQLSRPARGGL